MFLFKKLLSALCISATLLTASSFGDSSLPLSKDEKIAYCKSKYAELMEQLTDLTQRSYALELKKKPILQKVNGLQEQANQLHKTIPGIEGAVIKPAVIDSKDEWESYLQEENRLLEEYNQLQEDHAKLEQECSTSFIAIASELLYQYTVDALPYVGACGGALLLLHNWGLLSELNRAIADLQYL